MKKDRNPTFAADHFTFSIKNRSTELFQPLISLSSWIPQCNRVRKINSKRTISAISHRFFGDMTVRFGISRRNDRSNTPWCVSPSLPTSPARSTAIKTGRFEDRHHGSSGQKLFAGKRNIPQRPVSSCLLPVLPQRSSHAPLQYRHQKSLWEHLCKSCQSCPVCHRRSNCYYFFILLSDICKYFLKIHLYKNLSLFSLPTFRLGCQTVLSHEIWTGFLQPVHILFPFRHHMNQHCMINPLRLI